MGETETSLPTFKAALKTEGFSLDKAYVEAVNGTASAKYGFVKGDEKETQQRLEAGERPQADTFKLALAPFWKRVGVVLEGERRFDEDGNPAQLIFQPGLGYFQGEPSNPGYRWLQLTGRNTNPAGNDGEPARWDGLGASGGYVLSGGRFSGEIFGAYNVLRDNPDEIHLGFTDAGVVFKQGIPWLGGRLESSGLKFNFEWWRQNDESSLPSDSFMASVRWAYAKDAAGSLRQFELAAAGLAFRSRTTTAKPQSSGTGGQGTSLAGAADDYVTQFQDHSRNMGLTPFVELATPFKILGSQCSAGGRLGVTVPLRSERTATTYYSGKEDLGDWAVVPGQDPFLTTTGLTFSCTK